METIKAILKTICEQTLSKNTFFANGFYDTLLHEEKGLLLSNVDDQHLNITDVFGNYFYISYKPKATVSLGPSLSNSGRTFYYNYECSLVAVTEGMDELILINAIMNSIGGALQTINWVSTNAPLIISEELKPLSNEIINSVIAKIGKRQVVKINFTQRVTFQTQSCPINPADCGCGEEQWNIPQDPCCVPQGGTAGQVLTVDGNGVTRIWADPTGGTGGGVTATDYNNYFLLMGS